jgi:hypothetical protein
MSSRIPVDTASIHGRIDARVDRVSQSDIPGLNSLALGSLVSLLDEKDQLFAECITLTEAGLHREKASGKLSAIALLGLQRLAMSGARHSFDVSAIQDAVWKDRSWVKCVGDLGLLTWFTATCIPDRLGALFNEYDFGRAIVTYSDGREALTTSLAWFLAGIAHARLTRPNAAPDLTDIAVETYHSLQDNQSEGGIFGHAGSPRFLKQIFYKRYGTFADQIHAIYALTTFARAFQIEEPLASALACANSIRALQGEMGQWWFLYDKRTCRVVNRYPVCSLHQDGTAPVGLLALEEATGQNFRGPMYKGLSWVAGMNELGYDLRNIDPGLIWDSIGPSRRLANCWELACGFMNRTREPQLESLRVRYEVRPDHFGWLLYAFGKFGLPNSMIAAKAATAR